MFRMNADRCEKSSYLSRFHTTITVLSQAYRKFVKAVGLFAAEQAVWARSVGVRGSLQVKFP